MTPTVDVLQLVGVGHEHGHGAALVRALDEVDLAVHPGELVAVMGPSGSGKSTLLNIAGGLELPSKGKVIVNGEDLTALDAAGRAAVRRRSIGYVFQESNLIPGLSALENVALPLELDGTPTSKARRQAWSALEEIGMVDLADRFPEELSGGQVQKVALARALVGKRGLLLADEPTGALDTASGEAVIALLRDHVDRGAAGLLVTHEARYAAWADRTVFLRDGRIIDRTVPDTAEGLLRPHP